MDNFTPLRYQGHWKEESVWLINPVDLLSAVGLVDKTLLSNTKDCGFDSRLGSYFLGTLVLFRTLFPPAYEYKSGCYFLEML